MITLHSLGNFVVLLVFVVLSVVVVVVVGASVVVVLSVVFVLSVVVGASVVAVLCCRNMNIPIKQIAHFQLLLSFSSILPFPNTGHMAASYIQQVYQLITIIL